MVSVMVRVCSSTFTMLKQKLLLALAKFHSNLHVPNVLSKWYVVKLEQIFQRDQYCL